MAHQTSAGLAAQKFWSSSVYTQSGRALAVYSQRISKLVMEWATQDNVHATTLQQAAYLLAQAGGKLERFGSISTNNFPFAVPQPKAPKPQEAEETALSILSAIIASEQHTAQVCRATANVPAGKQICQYLDLEAIAEVSEARERIAKGMKAQIEAGRLWTSAEPTHWRCLQCGARHHGKSALEQCPCCKASRAHQTNGGW